jgi:uncharacterized protein (TIGR02466 family)
MILDVFKSTIFKTEIKNENYINYFKKVLNKEIKLNKGRVLSNRGGYQTNNLNEIKDIKVYEDIFIKPAIEFIKNLNCKKKNIEINLSNFWINLNNVNDYNIMHNHPASNLSGVYYIEVPKDSGSLVFQNHNLLANGFNNNYDFFDNCNFYTHYTIIPKKYDLILFPAELLHFVTPNTTNKKRISVAFNLNIK